MSGYSHIVYASGPGGGLILALYFLVAWLTAIILSSLAKRKMVNGRSVKQNRFWMVQAVETVGLFFLLWGILVFERSLGPFSLAGIVGLFVVFCAFIENCFLSSTDESKPLEVRVRVPISISLALVLPLIFVGVFVIALTLKLVK